MKEPISYNYIYKRENMKQDYYSVNTHLTSRNFFQIGTELYTLSNFKNSVKIRFLEYSIHISPKILKLQDNEVMSILDGLTVDDTLMKYYNGMDIDDFINQVSKPLKSVMNYIKEKEKLERVRDENLPEPSLNNIDIIDLFGSNDLNFSSLDTSKLRL